MKIKEELIGPAATLAAAILSKVEPEHSVFTREILTSAFEDAYFTLLDGIERVNNELERREKPAKKRAATGLAARKAPTKITVR